MSDFQAKMHQIRFRLEVARENGNIRSWTSHTMMMMMMIMMISKLTLRPPAFPSPAIRGSAIGAGGGREGVRLLTQIPGPQLAL